MKRRINLKRLLAILGSVILLIVGLLLFSLYRGFTGGQPIDYQQTQHADHPLFQGPFLADGSLDYYAALDRVSGDGIAREENFCVAILELASDSGELNPEVRSRYFSRLPYNRQAPHRFQTFSRLSEQLGDDASQLDTSQLAVDTFSTSIETFQDGQGTLIRKVLDLQNESLDQLLLELDARPYYFMPLVGDADQPQMVIAILLPHAQHHRELARWLFARSNRNLADGELAAAWRDIRGIYQLGNRVSQGITLVESLVGMAAHGIATTQMQTLLNQDSLTPDLLEKINRELSEVDSLQHWTQTVDRAERLMLLNTLDLLATGQLDDSTAAGWAGVEGLRYFPWGWVDGVQIADDWNAMIDEIMAAGQDPQPGRAAAVFEAFNRRLKERPKMRWGLAKALAGATPRKEATLLAEEILFGLLAPAMEMVHEAQLRTVAQQRMTRLGVAARRYEFAEGKLPESLDQLDSLIDPGDKINPTTGLPFLIDTEPVDGRAQWGFQVGDAAFYLESPR